MNLQEAYNLFGLPPSATPEEVKKQFKKLSKQFHPDVNKDPNAEAQFKRINEAHQIIQSGGANNLPPDWNNPFRNDRYVDPFVSFFSSIKKNQNASHVKLDLTLSFKEAVQGCKKNVSYSRKVKCNKCQGTGQQSIGNANCTLCKGQGHISNKKGNTVIFQVCPHCLSNRKSSACNSCSSVGVIDSNSSFEVPVPQATTSNTVLCLEGMGNFVGSVMGIQDQYTNVLISINVIPDPNLRLIDKDVVSDVSISLLDALKGCTQVIPSLNGNQEIQIPVGIKNKDEVSILTGDDNNITHRIIVNVNYPANIDKLIDVLSEGK